MRMKSFLLPAIFAFTAIGHSAPVEAADFVLALSWQPAFCEVAARRPECASQDESRFDADHFALHGLWPQSAYRSYCNVPQADVAQDKSGHWRKLPMAALSPDLRAELDVAMPGTRSGLERHEWLKHGTCITGATPQSYYAASLAILKAVNASPVRNLFADHVGKEVSGAEIRKAFDTAFGAGAGGRVRIACRRDGERRLISEITLGLSGELGATPDIAAMIAAAPVTKPGCPGGIVDATGLQ